MFFNVKNNESIKVNKSLKLRLILIIPFVLEIFAAVALVGYFATVNSQQAINNLANQLIDRASKQVDDHLDSYLSLPIQIAQMNTDAIKNKELNLDNPITSGRYFWKQGKAFKNISYIGYSLADGREAGVARWTKGIDLKADMKKVDIHEGIESTLLILQHRFNAKLNFPTIHIIKNYDNNLPLVECYAGQLNQVLMNILTNAIDALEEKVDNFIPTITIGTSVVNSQWIEIAIADNGVGMSEEIHNKIFDPFFTTKPVGKGTGMGMSISYQIITQKHGGKLERVSTLGVGTEFLIQIPVSQVI
jgi:signal transduction histidine kinase